VVSDNHCVEKNETIHQTNAMHSIMTTGRSLPAIGGSRAVVPVTTQLATGLRVGVSPDPRPECFIEAETVCEIRFTLLGVQHGGFARWPFDLNNL
jgi:hypothetical protein